MKKRIISAVLLLAMLVSVTGCESEGIYPGIDKDATYSVSDQEYKCTGYASMTPEEIVAGLTLEQKAAQMVMPAIYNVSPDAMKEKDYGSILSTIGSIDAAY